MNILQIISSPASGGAEIYVKSLAIEMAKQGHNVHVAFLSTATDINRSEDFENAFLKELYAHNINTFFIGNQCRKNILLGMMRVNKYINAHKIDICHSHLIYGCLFSSRIKVPLVFTYHNIIELRYKITYKILNSLVDRYVGISERCAYALESATGRQVVTIFNGVPKKKLLEYRRERNLSETLNISMIGRLNPQKDYPNLFKAISLLPDKVLKRIRIQIAGEGNEVYKQKLISLIESRNLVSNIQLIGLVTDIPKFLSYSDLFIMSSAWEGLPIALLEATLSGLPCIVTDVGGCSEVVDISKNGLVVPSKNPEALAKAIMEFFNDELILNRFSKNALKFSDQFSISTSAQKHISLYQDLI